MTKSVPQVFSTTSSGGGSVEVMEDKPKTIADVYSRSIDIVRTGRGNRLYPTNELFVAAIKSYFQDILNHDGTYNRPPTLTGLGVHLGFASKTWYNHYENADDFKVTMAHVRTVIELWRQEQATIPSKGVYPAGLMFLMQRDDQQAAGLAAKDITPSGEDKQPKEADALITDMWRKHIHFRGK